MSRQIFFKGPASTLDTADLFISSYSSDSFMWRPWLVWTLSQARAGGKQETILLLSSTWLRWFPERWRRGRNEADSE